LETKKIQYVVRRKGVKEGRPLQGASIKKFIGVRLQEHLIPFILEKHGTLQKWADCCVKREFKSLVKRLPEVESGQSD
jgi:hypothetical protein